MEVPILFLWALGFFRYDDHVIMMSVLMVVPK